MDKHLLVSYSWSINNIGDIGITPGLLNLIAREKENLPVKILAWQTAADPAYQIVRDYLPRYKKNCEVLPMPFFDSEGDLPQENDAWLKLVERWGKSKLESFRKGTLSSYESARLVDDLLDRYALELFETLKIHNPHAAAAFTNAGFVYYNSGTTLNYGRLGVKNLWGYTLPLAMSLIIARRLGIPYGIGSQSFDALEWPMDLLYKKLFADAEFVYCRDTDSLNYLSQRGLTNKFSGWRPDSTFFFKGFDEAWADSFMAENKLENEKFMCVMLRISEPKPKFNDPTGGTVSEERKLEQMRKMKIFLEAWIRKTGCKVLLCHETRATLKSAKNYLYDILAGEAKRQCVYMDTFWSSEQAYSVFKRARLVVSMEMHSIIMAINVGTPIIHNPYDECGRKKWMINDLGLGDCLLDIDSCADDAMLGTAMNIHCHYDDEKNRVAALRIPLETRALETLQEAWRAWRP